MKPVKRFVHNHLSNWNGPDDMCTCQRDRTENLCGKTDMTTRQLDNECPIFSKRLMCKHITDMLHNVEVLETEMLLHKYKVVL
jgi:hypothetical protein